MAVDFTCNCWRFSSTGVWLILAASPINVIRSLFLGEEACREDAFRTVCYLKNQRK